MKERKKQPPTKVSYDVCDIRYRPEIKDLRMHTSAAALGIRVSIDGYEAYVDDEGEYGNGYVVEIENWNGHPRILVWADRKEEIPTHIISLRDAMNPEWRTEE